MDYISELKQLIAETAAHPECVIIVKRSHLDALLVERGQWSGAYRVISQRLSEACRDISRVQADLGEMTAQSQRQAKVIQSKTEYAGLQCDEIAKLRAERQKLHDENAQLRAEKSMVAGVGMKVANEAPEKFIASEAEIARIKAVATRYSGSPNGSAMSSILKELNFRRENAAIRESRRKDRVNKFGAGIQVLVDGAPVVVTNWTQTGGRKGETYFGINAVLPAKIVEPVCEVVADQSGNGNHATVMKTAKKSPAKRKLVDHRDQAAKYVGAHGTGGAPEAIVAIIDYLIGKA